MSLDCDIDIKERGPGCPAITDTDGINDDDLLNDPPLNPLFPFRFVDGNVGLWSTTRVHRYTSTSVLDCPFHSTIVFHYPKGTHDVVRLHSSTFYEECNFLGSEVLFPSTYEELFINTINTTTTTTTLPKNDVDVDVRFDLPDVTYYHKCMGEINSTEYISCSFIGHC